MKKKEMPVAGRPRCPVVPPRRRGSARPRERGGGHTQGETDPRGGGAGEAPAGHGRRSGIACSDDRARAIASAVRGSNFLCVWINIKDYMHACVIDLKIVRIKQNNTALMGSFKKKYCIDGQDM